MFCSDQLHIVQVVRFGVWESETSRYLQIGTSKSAVSVGYSILMYCRFELFTGAPLKLLTLFRTNNIQFHISVYVVPIVACFCVTSIVQPPVY